MDSKRAQQGMGLLEVMISLVILLIAVAASGKLQTNGMMSARISSFHFSLDHLSSEMLETLRAHSIDANAGSLNFDSISAGAGGGNSGTAATDGTTVGGNGSAGTSPVATAVVQKWITRVSNDLPSGAASVDCAAGSCNIILSWMEEIDGSYHRQYYRTRTPL